VASAAWIGMEWHGATPTRYGVQHLSTSIYAYLMGTLKNLNHNAYTILKKQSRGGADLW